jgi:hypothetical protein
LLFSCLVFCFFSYLSLNNLLHLTDLARASTSASIANFGGVSVKTALPLLFRLPHTIRASAFGKVLF